jgi:Tfp pilus assembly protein PilO
MTGHVQGGSLSRRLLAEHRRVIVPLLAALVINLLVYAFAVYPLAQRVANIEERDRAAEQSLAQARREHDAARGALVGKERATVELATFYKDVLPPDLAGARRLTYLRLAQLVREAGLKYENSTYDPVIDRESTLARFQIHLIVTGSYENIRALIYQLDTAPEFVVIDNIALTEGSAQGGGLQLELQLSTYYRVVQP